MALSTDGNDTLTTTSTGEILLGQGGNDRLESSHNHVVLSGGDGNDTLYTFFSESASSAAQSQPVFAASTSIGGAGNDSLYIGQDAGSRDAPSGSLVTAYGGFGTDRIDILNNACSETQRTNASVFVYDAGGKNRIQAQNYAYSSGNGRGLSTSYTNIFAGGGADTISVDGAAENTRAVVFANGGSDQVSVRTMGLTLNLETTTDVTVDGGSGHDTLSASIQPSGIADASAEALCLITGGGGNDLIIATLFEFNVNSEPASLRVSNNLDAGTGNDTIESEIFADRQVGYFSVVENYLYGGRGRDSIYSFIGGKLSSDGTRQVDSTIKGGASNDTITSIIDSDAARSYTSYSYVTNRIEGGGGSDVLSGTVNGFGSNDIFGGNGNDVITATGGFGNSLFGGKGQDTITGSDNGDAINGGSGKDLIIVGGGNDTIIGGTGGDTFVLSSTGNGTNTINDWNRTYDRLDIDLIDGNGNGLVDEFDTDATILDDGTDVSVQFSGGTVIVFSDIGNGSITSIADIVSDAGLQIV